MSNYWQERFVEEEKRLNKMAQREVEVEYKEYEKTLASLNRDIEIWYNRIAINNEVSLADAKRLLSGKELKEFKWSLEEYIKYGKENVGNQRWIKELENASARIHIERLEALKLQTRSQIEKLYNERIKGFDKYVKEIYKDQYERTAFELAKGTGVGTKLYKLNDNLVESIVKKPWTPDGKHFSERIWNDKEKLVNTIHTELTQGFIRGDSLNTLTDKIASKMNVSKSSAARLVHTESAAYSSKARLQSYQDIGVEQYEVVATLDSRTSEICQSFDGKVFDMKDYEVGATAPPFHVRCRTTTAPYFADEIEEEETRTARSPQTGKTEYVPRDMKYGEWREKYLVEGKSGNDTGKVVEKIENLYEEFIAKEPLITLELKKIIHNTNGYLEGLEYRIKSKTSLFRKIDKEFIENDFNLSKIDIFKKTNDILRYTTILDNQTFLSDYEKIKKLLLGENYSIIKVKNTWKDGNVYKGINTIIEKNGIKLEMQYHTKESFELKNGTLHKLYEEFRSLDTSFERKRELQKEMINLSLKIKNPKGVDKI